MRKRALPPTNATYGAASQVELGLRVRHITKELLVVLRRSFTESHRHPAGCFARPANELTNEMGSLSRQKKRQIEHLLVFLLDLLIVFLLYSIPNENDSLLATNNTVATCEILI